MSDSTVKIVAAVLFLVVVAVLIMRRKGKKANVDVDDDY
jgi:hypothetical protein